MIFKNDERIVFAGDSVTDRGSTNPVGEGLFDSLGFGYVRVLENILTAWYPETNLRITNSGIGGNTSRDLLNRFNRDVVDLKPDWVSICIGINDVWRQFDSPAIKDQAVFPDEYERNLEEMVVKIRDKVNGVFIMSPYYIEPNREDLMRKRMDEYVDISKKIAFKYNCTFINLQEMFENFCKFQHSARISWDRVHPNQIGATLIAREFLKYIEFEF